MPKVPKQDIYDQVFESTQPFDESYYKEGDGTHFVDFVDWAVENEVFPPKRDRTTTVGSETHGSYRKGEKDAKALIFYTLIFALLSYAVDRFNLPEVSAMIVIAYNSFITGLMWFTWARSK